MKYVFKIVIKKGHTTSEYIRAWEKGSKIIQQFPGARGTRLYKKIGEPSTLLAIADWKSKKYRDAALKGVDNVVKLGLDANKIVHAHRNYGKFFPIGEFEEVAKVFKCIL